MEEDNKRITKNIINSISALNLQSKEFDSLSENVINSILHVQKQSEELNKNEEQLDLHINELEIMRNNTCKTLTEINNELQTYRTELNDVESKYNSLVAEFENIEQECLKIKKPTKLSSTHENDLFLSRKRYELYVEMTNIVWDYTVPLVADVVRGYFKIRDKKFVRRFEYNEKEISPSERTEKLWKEIEQGVGEDWSDIVNMTTT